MKIIKTIAILLILCSCKNTVEKDEKTHPLINYLENQRVEPTTYVINKFKDHDVIFIGENHWIKQQVEFVEDLIPELYKNGIYNLGTEFINYEDTQLVNKLITADTFHNQLAEEITFKSDWGWGYKEYIDIYKKAWELNKSLPSDAKKFRIFGIQEVMDFSHVNKEEDFDNPEIMRKVFSGFDLFDESEGYSAYAIEKEVLDKSEKALIHCGINHAFTSFYQPVYIPKNKDENIVYEKERMGNLIKNKIGDKAITIFMHGPWTSKDQTDFVLPVDGVLDSLFSINEFQKQMPFGVDTKDTPFGDLKGETSYYINGYPDFSLKQFCDGYIFFNPVKDYKVVTQIPNFIKPEQIDYIEGQEFQYRNKGLTAEKLNDTIRMHLEVQRKRLKELK